MKKRFFIGGWLMSILWLGAYGQMDTIFTHQAYTFDSAGFIAYVPGTVLPAEPLSVYLSTSGDIHTEFVPIKQWEDSVMHLEHRRYQQTYKGLEVEGAEFFEHSYLGYLVTANGKVVPDLNASATPDLSEVDALDILLSHYPNYSFAWMSDAWEEQARQDLDDMSATNYPTGQLMWALRDYENLGYKVSGGRYRLAWKFDVLSITPFFHKTFFVDAMNGDILREINLLRDNGPANVHSHGIQTIDTKQPLGANHWILKADDQDRMIHTKYFDGHEAWWKIDEVEDQNDNWGGTTQVDAASVHWFATESWDYFKAEHNLEGPDDHNGRVRCQAHWSLENGGYTKNLGIDYIILGVEHGKAIDVVGHEYTHGVTANSARLAGYGEPGALDESFSDIFGQMIERRAEGGSPAFNWLYGEDPGTIMLRSFSDPNSQGEHELGDPGCNNAPGQPDTYTGTFWANTASNQCDLGGIHSNNAVQNHWFYLLAVGGSGVNDLGTAYNVQGIGIDAAARIAYLSLTTKLGQQSNFADARLGSITVAMEEYGPCSNEEIQCTNAWNAVGVVGTSPCNLTAQANAYAPTQDIIFYPNPATGKFSYLSSNPQPCKIIVRNLLGQVVIQEDAVDGRDGQLDLADFPDGLYLAEVVSKKSSITVKLVKQGTK